MNETTLKRAVLLYDEILFVDPVNSLARVDLFRAPHAHPMVKKWEEVRWKYAILERAGLVRFVDPARTVGDPAAGQLIADALRADLDDRDARALVPPGPTEDWWILRSRIPQPVEPHLPLDLGWRTLRGYEGESIGKLPYRVGSSIAVSTALALTVAENAVPLTDSDAHFRLLSMRMARAAASVPPALRVPGLTARPDSVTLQKDALVQQRMVDAVISQADFAALSLEDCLRYRERTANEREQFRGFLRAVERATTSEPWSPHAVAEIESHIEAAKREISEQAESLRDAYRSLFNRTLTGLSLSAAPALVATVFPYVSPLTALLFGGGSLTAILAEPVKELLALWTDQKRGTSSLAYLMNVPEEAGAGA
ncbi:hypothetical protein [Streptomyces europaeiscabiei]|uniref:hypothetical protein n=1 Tax=Streptomyces europaeiscabiei TaxID=146819 RepID=UPI002E2ACB72|nr:hypothetical protein [Streptomyces europaeiscabiei]